MTPTSQRRTGYVLTGLVILFLLFDSVGKLLRLRQMVEGTAALGYPDSAVRLIGAILLACLTLYMVPRTAVLGGILLTGYLGGAVASNLRVGSPLFSHTLFPIYVGVLIWGSLLLRGDRLRALVPVRSEYARKASTAVGTSCSAPRGWSPLQRSRAGLSDRS